MRVLSLSVPIVGVLLIPCGSWCPPGTGCVLSKHRALWGWRMRLHFRCAVVIGFVLLLVLSSKFLSKGSNTRHLSWCCHCNSFFPLSFPQKIVVFFCDIFFPKFCPHSVSTQSGRVCLWAKFSMSSKSRATLLGLKQTHTLFDHVSWSKTWAIFLKVNRDLLGF